MAQLIACHQIILVVINQGMHMDPFMESLRNRPAAIQERIEREQARPAPDSLRLYGLKNLKLKFRDQIEYPRVTQP
ncbi:hypothetical protein FHS85_005335 [Rhodoligotrophos appendicifer]